MKKIEIKLTPKQIGYVLLGLAFYEGCGNKQDERYALELREKIINQVGGIK